MDDLSPADSKLIIYRLDKQDETLQRIESKLSNHGEDIAGLKKTAGFAGLLGGMLPAFMAFFINRSE